MFSFHQIFENYLLNDVFRFWIQNEYKLLTDQYETELQSNIVETIVKVKTTVAKEHKITINFTYEELEKIRISPIDIAIILGNALDNAIEATQKIDSSSKAIDILINMCTDMLVHSPLRSRTIIGPILIHGNNFIICKSNK